MSRLEQEIQKYWKDQAIAVRPLVSIVCITYNQKLYIKDAIESFLMQETTFPFEIIIHDDASTDGTAEIIKEYVERYPSILKAILQKENQYSQKGFAFLKSVYAVARGEFFAVCDGDDYWTDPQKLAIQIAEMKKYPLCNVSFHSTICKESNKEDIESAKYGNVNRVFSIQEVILNGGGFCPTASLVFRGAIFQQLPDFIYSSPVLDYPLQILASQEGGMLYIPKSMSVYRVKAIHSWSQRTQNDIKAYVDQSKKLINALDHLNDYTNKAYDKEFLAVKRKIRLKILYKKLINFVRNCTS